MQGQAAFVPGAESRHMTPWPLLPVLLRRNWGSFPKKSWYMRSGRTVQRSKSPRGTRGLFAAGDSGRSRPGRRPGGGAARRRARARHRPHTLAWCCCGSQLLRNLSFISFSQPRPNYSGSLSSLTILDGVLYSSTGLANLPHRPCPRSRCFHLKQWVGAFSSFRRGQRCSQRRAGVRGLWAAHDAAAAAGRDLHPYLVISTAGTTRVLEDSRALTGDGDDLNEVSDKCALSNYRADGSPLASIHEDLGAVCAVTSWMMSTISKTRRCARWTG